MKYKYTAWVGEYKEDAVIQDEIDSSWWGSDQQKWIAEEIGKQLFAEGLFEKEINIRIYDSAAGDDLGLFKVSAVPTHIFYAVEVK